MQTRNLDLSSPKKSIAYQAAMHDLEVIQARKHSEPLAMSGDAWEAAACFVINLKNQNADSWKHISTFLEDQQLSLLGLRRVPKHSAAGCAGAPATALTPREAHPVGNTGITSTIVNGVSK